jgi:hypothetical protein
LPDGLYSLQVRTNTAHSTVIGTAQVQCTH